MNVKLCLSAAVLSAVSSFCFLSCSTAEQELSYKGVDDSPSSLQQQKPYTQEEIDRAIYVQGSAIVKLTPEAADAMAKGDNVLASASGELGMTGAERLFPDAGKYEPRHRKYGLNQYYIVNFDSALPLSKAQTLLESVSSVESFEKRNRMRLSDKTNDPGYSYLWEYGGNYSINVEEAWEYTTGDPSVVVCVVDEGVALSHEDLSWNCGNTHYNFVRKSTSIVAGDHGSHVAGTIAGVRNNGKGLAGIAGGDYAAGKKGVTLMSAEVFQGNSSASSFENAIVWGADNGAVISQNSWGNDYDFDDDGRLSEYEKNYALSDKITQSMADAIDYFIDNAGCDEKGNQLPDSPMKGGVVVFAAGNDGIANGVPAAYGPVIAVGSVGSTGRLSSFSNYGSWVDICAPGEYIYSCIASGGYDRYSGTSMACPHVSGALALLLSEFGGEGFTNEDLTDILLSGANPDLISISGKAMGPYLDLMGSIRYGLDKFRRENNNPPVITTSYTGNFKFRQWENISIPFTVTDPDGDKVNVTSEIEGRAKLVQSQSDASAYNFELLCELVTDFAPMNVKITATDIYGGVTEYEFTYQVTENRAPILSMPILDELLSDNDNVVVSLDGVFSDPDDDPMEYSASVSPSDVVSVSVDGTSLTITRKKTGLAVVTVTATDCMGAKVSTDFQVLARDGSYDLDYYPNPVRDYLNLRPGCAESVKVGVRISSLSGAELYSETLSCCAFHPTRVDMRGFAPGRYRLHLTMNGKEYDYLIVKI